MCGHAVYAEVLSRLAFVYFSFNSAFIFRKYNCIRNCPKIIAFIRTIRPSLVIAQAGSISALRGYHKIRKSKFVSCLRLSHSCGTAGHEIQILNFVSWNGLFVILYVGRKNRYLYYHSKCNYFNRSSFVSVRAPRTYNFYEKSQYKMVGFGYSLF